MDNLLFSRGYIVSEKSYDSYLDQTSQYMASKWKRKRINNIKFYFDPVVEFNYTNEKNNLIVLFGSVIDPINNDTDSKKIIGKLLDKFLSNKNEFYNYLDLLTGRFTLIIKTQYEFIVLHDATGINTCFYNSLKSNIIISSHSQIIAEIMKYKISDQRRTFISSEDFINQSRYFPGFKTVYEEINLLSPNTLLDLNNKKIVRFFPREKLVKQKINKDLIQDLSDLLSNTINLLCKKYKLAVSLTGGIDSRLTLACSKNNKNKIVYFTYVYNNDKGHLKDLSLAENLALKFKFNHKVFKINGEKYADYIPVFNRNSAFIRSENQGKLSRALFDVLPKDRVHIKSTVSEIGEGFYLRHFPPIPPFKSILHYLFSYYYRIHKFSKFSKESFKEFIKKTDFYKVIKNKYNYFDMFYWEHRNGCWQSLQNQDFDIIHDIFIIYNNREILKKFLSAPISDRLNCTLQREIIKNIWPELLEVPINSWKPSTQRERFTNLLWNQIK